MSAPASNRANVCVAVQTHVTRIFAWMLVRMEPLPLEAAALSTAGVTNPTWRSYAVWRRSMLLVALPLLLYNAVASLVAVQGFDVRVFTPFGKFVYVCPFAAGVVSVMGAVLAWWNWTHHERSNRFLCRGWLVSLALVVLPALVPIQWILSSSVAVILQDDEFRASLAHSLTVAFSVILIPIVMSLALASVRAAVRIRGLVPHSTTAGWIVVASLPFYTTMILLGLALASQYVGDILLMAAMVLFLMGPLVYSYNHTLYTKPITAETEPKLYQGQMMVRIANVTGVVFLVLWLATAEWNGQNLTGTKDVDDTSTEPLWTYANMVHMWIEFLGRTMVTTIVCADVFVQAAPHDSDVRDLGSTPQPMPLAESATDVSFTDQCDEL